MTAAVKPDSDSQLDVEIRKLLSPVIALRVRLFFAGVVFPVGCFIVAADSPPTIDTPWQSGRTADYVALLLTWPGYAPFLPLVVFSQICLAAWLIVPESGRRMIIRLGIYSGLVMSLQFLLFVLMTTAILTFLVAAVVGPVFALIVAACVRIPRYTRQFAIRHVLILTAVVAVIIAIARLIGVPLNADLWLPAMQSILMYILMAAPVLCVIAYTRATIAVAPQAEPHQGKYGWVAETAVWVVGWAGAWKLALDIMLVEYSKLPTTDPNCYVSSAAAHGHPTLVGTCRCGDGVQPMNLQTRRLKFLEIVLKAALPGIHFRLRRVYDRVGPALARQCRRSIWFADATYLMLKPIEWLSEMIRIILRIRRSSIQCLYGAESAGQSIA